MRKSYVYRALAAAGICIAAGTLSAAAFQEEAHAEGGALIQQVIDGRKYMVREDGTHYTGWYDMTQEWRLYFDPDEDGAAATGFAGADGRYYLFDENGVQFRNGSGTPVIRGEKYWFNSDDSLNTGWLTLGEWTMYFDPQDGAAYTGLSEIEGERYLFDGNGVLRAEAGTPVIDGKKYWFGDSGALNTGWLHLGSWVLYFDPVTCEGAMDTLLDIDGKTYYFDENGVMFVGTIRIGQYEYTFGADGAMTDKKEARQIVVIDPGHQARGDSRQEPIGPGSSVTKPRVSSGTAGCVSGLDEYELNLQVSLLLRTELESRGYTVYMTRETHDVNISNKERAEYAASVGGDILVRIHANSSGDSSVKGALCMAPSFSNPYVSGLAKDSQRLATCVVDSYCAATGLKNRGLYIADDMSGINWAAMPVTIVEMGFMSNPGDDAQMADPEFEKLMVRGIADGIDAYFGTV